jgi:hypothetical protein
MKTIFVVVKNSSEPVAALMDLEKAYKIKERLVQKNPGNYFSIQTLKIEKQNGQGSV